MLPAETTRVTEDYLPLIWKAYEWPGGRPTTTDLAHQLGVQPSTVSATLKKLALQGYITYQPYGAITLTETGYRIAVDLVRRHRIIEAYLATHLDLGWDQVHTEADLLEHAISETVLHKMNEKMGHPDTDPHGAPIPGQTHQPHAQAGDLLASVPAQETVEVIRVSDRSQEILQHLHHLGMTVGTHLLVENINEPADAMTLTINSRTTHLSLRLATHILVRKLNHGARSDPPQPAHTETPGPTDLNAVNDVTE